MKKQFLLLLFSISFIAAKAQLPNLPPVAFPDILGTFEDSDVKLLITANDKDPEGRLDPQSITIIEGPRHGFAEISDTVVIYTPEPDFFGRDTFTYSIKDIESNESNLPGIVSIEVIAINDYPTAINDTVSYDSPETAIEVLNNDYDVDGTIDSSSLELLEGPRYGFVQLDSATATFYYTAGGNFTGSDEFRYQVRDNEGERTPARVFIGPINTGVMSNIVLAIESNISPNPVTGRSFINFMNVENKLIQVLITDVTGRTIRNIGSTNGTTIEFNKATLSPGTYFYILISEGKNIARNKFIIQ